MAGFSITRDPQQCLWLSFTKEIHSDDLSQMAEALSKAIDYNVNQLIIDRRNQQASIRVDEAVEFGELVGPLFYRNRLRVALLEEDRHIIDDIIANQILLSDVETATFDNERDAKRWLDS